MPLAFVNLLGDGRASGYLEKYLLLFGSQSINLPLAFVGLLNIPVEPLATV